MRDRAGSATRGLDRRQRAFRRDARVGALHRCRAECPPRLPPDSRSFRPRKSGFCGCVAKKPLDPVHVPLPRELALDRGRGARAQSAGMELVSQHAPERSLEAGLVTRCHEAAVLAVDEPVTGGNGQRARDNHRLSERHCLQEDGRGAGIAVLPDGQRDDTRLVEPPPHLLERDVGLDDDVIGRPGKVTRMLSIRDDPKRSRRACAPRPRGEARSRDAGRFRPRRRRLPLAPAPA